METRRHFEDGDIGEALGKLYVGYYFRPEAKSARSSS